MERTDVYATIDGERDYQDKMWGGHKHDQFHSVGDFIVYMDFYMAKAKEAYTTLSGHNAALDVLRKVVTLGVACFEIHRVPKRVINTDNNE